MASRTFLSTVALTVATASTLVGACSSSSSSNGGTVDSGAATDSNTTDGPAAEDAAYVTGGLVGCAVLEDGCYRQSGPYTAPTVMNTCADPGKGTTAGAADKHCDGMTPQAIDPAACSATGDAGAPTPPMGPCGENGSDYGATQYGSEADDDDCKYHASWEASPICKNDGTYFTVTASYLAGTKGPLTGACTFAELCLSDTHPGPIADGRPPMGKQTVTEGPPGTYTVGPVVFDESGDWTVRFHFNEICCDVLPGSPHGHVAFHVAVP